MNDYNDNSKISTSSFAESKNTEPGPKESWIKCRYVALLMGITIEFFLYAHRITVGVTIVSMVNNSALTSGERPESESCLNLLANTSYEEQRRYLKKDGEFNWSPEFQGYVLGGSFLCFALGTFPGGKLVELFGCKKILTWGFFLASLCTFISPFAAWGSVYLLIIVQSLRGLFQAGFVPAQAVLIANWCPKSERGFSYTIILSGSCWGAVLGSYLSGLMCDTPLLRGWPLAYFAFGGLGVIASLLMAIFMYDNPSVHPTISPSEFKYIIGNQENALKQRRPKTPWSSLFTSVPVYALACAYFGQMWALCHFLSIYPTFLGTILHYPIEQNGLFCALPFLLQFVTAVSSGWLSNFLTNNKYMSIDMSRKFWNNVASLGYSACLLGIYFSGCNRYLSIIFGISSSALVGFANAGCWITSADMSPTFAASVNSIACTIGFTSNFILPLVVGFLTNNMQTIEQWDKIHFISAAVVTLSGVVFHFFGSAEVQPWNDVPKEDTSEIEKETRLLKIIRTLLE